MGRALAKPITLLNVRQPFEEEVALGNEVATKVGQARQFLQELRIGPKPVDCRKWIRGKLGSKSFGIQNVEI
jgi:hypothetical protein